MTRAVPVTSTLRSRLQGTPRAVMLDIDGTLAPIVSRPEDAAVPPATLDAIRRLTALPANHVGLVTGRGVRDARRMVPLPGLWAVGNHGIEVMSPADELEVETEVAPYATAIAEASRRISALVADKAGVQLEDKTWTLSIYYRRADQSVVPGLVAALEAIAGQLGLLLTPGKAVMEVRPPVRIDKGTAVVKLAEHLGADAPGALVFYMGDDRTDEDAFRALRARWPHSVTVRVGADGIDTDAEFTVDDTGEALTLIEAIAGP